MQTVNRTQAIENASMSMSARCLGCGLLGSGRLGWGCSKDLSIGVNEI